jgi:uncharacterized protein (DUF4415 family)
MKTKIVRYALDGLPPLTRAEKSALAKLAARPDGDIDYSDLPPMSAAQWRSAERGRFYRPVKQQITARVDADVLDWLKTQGKGYQSRMNGILRRVMVEARRTGAPRRGAK